MDATRFDQISKLFAERKLSRRQALRQGGAGLAAAGLAVSGIKAATATAQDATPDVTAAGGKSVEYLFLQSFQSGSIAPKEGEADTFTLTLEQGLGQTLYFSDRPERIVGAAPTDQFLAELGFPADNPPNAALVIDAAPGETDIAVLELFNPVFNADSPGVTYDVKVLAEWERTLDMQFSEEPSDLSLFPASFGSAHLFIDDAACSNNDINCIGPGNAGAVGGFANHEYCWNGSAFACVPCETHDFCPSCVAPYWRNKCNADFPACNGNCSVAGKYFS